MRIEDATRLGTVCWRLWSESQAVIAYRLLDVTGLKPTAPSELARMAVEKPLAFAEATFAATEAAMRGRRPDQIAVTALETLQARTGANSRRLRNPEAPR
ncbi:hypothetical protein [Roseisalinus antarcticus]|uniref:Uncharacterized protein n=1 Tax=Roseisalinus antarcticus TaxID=254357 RepID=A0A1Y5T453_9RHOB|nr:hypothetical protein [Roseisalinus antarcticus]SLN51927.1 hypothetical protein ROA7023_02281 [Roseisalinus antarcticus]